MKGGEKMAKKIYKKPEIKPQKLFEAGAVICCKITPAACKASTRADMGGKGNRTTDTS